MIVSWVLRSKEQVCEWTFQAPMFRFSVGQDINEFFNLVDALHQSVSQIREMMKDGMDPQAAIAEWEKMIKEKDNPVGVSLIMPGAVKQCAGLLLQASDDKPEHWQAAKQSVVDMLKKQIGDRNVDVVLSISMPCGEKLEFKTFDDILVQELKDVPCPCGDPTHWLIKCEVRR